MERLHKAVASAITEDEPEGESLKDDAKTILSNALESVPDVSLKDLLTGNMDDALESTPALFHFLELFLSQATEFIIEKTDIQGTILKFYKGVKQDWEDIKGKGSALLKTKKDKKEEKEEKGKKDKKEEKGKKGKDKKDKKEEKEEEEEEEEKEGDPIFQAGGLDLSSWFDIVGQLQEKLEEEINPKVEAACDTVIPEEADPGIGLSVGVFMEIKLPMNTLCKSFFKSVAKDTIKSLLAFAGNYAQKYSTGKDNFLSFDGLIDLVQGKYSEEEKVNKNPLVKVVKLALNCEDSPATNAEGWIKESCKQKQWKKFAESEELWKAMHDGKDKKEWESFQKRKLVELQRVVNIDEDMVIEGVSHLAGFLIWLTQEDIRKPLLKRKIAHIAVRFFGAMFDEHSFNDARTEYSCGHDPKPPEGTPKRQMKFRCDIEELDSKEKCDKAFKYKWSSGNNVPCVWVPKTGATYPNPDKKPEINENASDEEKLKMTKARKNYKALFPISHTTDPKTFKVEWKVEGIEPDPKKFANVMKSSGQCIAHRGYVCKQAAAINCDDRTKQVTKCKPGPRTYRTVEDCNKATEHGIIDGIYHPCHCVEESKAPDNGRCEKCRAMPLATCEKVEAGSLTAPEDCDPNIRTLLIQACADTKTPAECEKSFKIKEVDYSNQKGILMTQPCRWDENKKVCHSGKYQQRRTCQLRDCTATAWASYKDRDNRKEGCNYVNSFRKTQGVEARKAACKTSGFMANHGLSGFAHQCYWNPVSAKCEGKNPRNLAQRIKDKVTRSATVDKVSPHCKIKETLTPGEKGFKKISIHKVIKQKMSG